jgi:SulP family sulfate permease
MNKGFKDWKYPVGISCPIKFLFVSYSAKRVKDEPACSKQIQKGIVNSIKTIGDLYTLPSGIPSPSMPALNLEEGQTIWSVVRSLMPAAFTIAMLGAIESLLSAMVADGVISDKHNSNTELIGQGIANVLCPFFGGIPATGAIARTMTNINNGGRTPVAGIVHALILLLVLLFMGPLVGLIPMPCLAAVLIIVAYNMSGWRTFVSLYNGPKSDFAVLMTTFVLTVIFDLTIAIEIGLLLAVVLFLKRTSESVEIRHFHDEIDPNQELDIQLNSEEKLSIPEGVDVYEIDGPYFFGIANKFEEVMSRISQKPKVRIIRMRRVPFMDSTGIHNLEVLIEQSHKEGVQIVLSGVNKQVRTALEKAGFAKLIPTENICSNINVALERSKELI